MSIGAVIFDFNGVLVDDEAVHCALFQEVLAEQGVEITERDYHDRYLGYDDRGCLEAALSDAGQTADRARIDRLIAQKARRYIEVAAQGLRFFPMAAETLAAVAALWPVAICSGALRPEIEYALRRLGGWSRSPRSFRPRIPPGVSPTPKVTAWPWPRCRRMKPREIAIRRYQAGPVAPFESQELPGHRRQPGRHRFGQGGRDDGRWRAQYLHC